MDHEKTEFLSPPLLPSGETDTKPTKPSQDQNPEVQNVISNLTPNMEETVIQIPVSQQQKEKNDRESISCVNHWLFIRYW